MTYADWMRRINVLLVAKIGVSQADLPDWLSRDAYDDGLSPEDAVEEILDMNGCYPEDWEAD